MAEDIKKSGVTPFEASVDSFSHKNVNGNPNLDKRSMIPSLIVRSILIAICIGMFGYAVFMLASSAVETEEVNELYESVRPENLSSAIKPSTPLLEPSPMYTLQQMADANGKYNNYVGDVGSVDDIARRSSYYRNYKSFKTKYDDAFAWIYVNHTQIDYPVMKGPNTDYYLYHNINGNSSSSGSIVAESNLSNNYDENLNTVIYGHCMKNGSMFRTLKTFLESANKNTLAKTMEIEIYTEDGLYIYKILSGYREDGAHFAKTFFRDVNDYRNFLDTIASKNTLRYSEKYNSSSKVVTLITCANVTSNEEERYVLHGVLVSFIPASNL